MDKRTFCIRVAIWVAVIAAMIITAVGLIFGTVIEESLFAEIMKWVVMGLCVIGILEGFVYFLAPLVWHFTIERKKKK